MVGSTDPSLPESIVIAQLASYNRDYARDRRRATHGIPTPVHRLDSSVRLFLALFLVGCRSTKAPSDPNRIIVGVQSGPEYALAEAARAVAKDKYGLTVELVKFDDYVLPNEALHQGDIDANVYQNQPYLDTQSQQRGYNFVAVGKTFVYPLAGYSKKLKSLSELTEGSQIAIPNDLTNSGRALLLLQKVGLIKLRDGVGLLPKPTDIIENPKKLEIVELEAPQLPRVLDDDKVAIAVINNTFARPAGLISTRDGLFVEDRDSPYVNLVVTRPELQNEDRLRKFVQSYQSPEEEKAAQQEFQGGAIKGW